MLNAEQRALLTKEELELYDYVDCHCMSDVNDNDVSERVTSVIESLVAARIEIARLRD